MHYDGKNMFHIPLIYTFLHFFRKNAVVYSGQIGNFWAELVSVVFQPVKREVIFMIPIDYDMIVFKEEGTYVAYCPELDVSSCGNTVEHTKEMLKTAVRLLLEEAEKMDTLNDILEEARYRKDASGRWQPPKLVATELVSVS